MLVKIQCFLSRRVFFLCPLYSPPDSWAPGFSLLKRNVQNKFKCFSQEKSCLRPVVLLGRHTDQTTYSYFHKRRGHFGATAWWFRSQAGFYEGLQDIGVVPILGIKALLMPWGGGPILFGTAKATTATHCHQPSHPKTKTMQVKR